MELRLNKIKTNRAQRNLIGRTPNILSQRSPALTRIVSTVDTPPGIHDMFYIMHLKTAGDNPLLSVYRTIPSPLE